MADHDPNEGHGGEFPAPVFDDDVVAIFEGESRACGGGGDAQGGAEQGEHGPSVGGI